MKTFILTRTALLLICIVGTIQAGAKNVYIKTGTGKTPSVANSTAIDPASFSELKNFLSAYRVDTTDDKQLNVYFDAGTYIIQKSDFLRFNQSSDQVNGLEVTFQPMSPSGGGTKGVVFDGEGKGTGASDSRFIQLRGDASKPMTMLIKDIKIQNFNSTASSGDGGSSLFTIAAGASLTLDSVVIDQIKSYDLSFAYLAEKTSSLSVRNSTLSNVAVIDTWWWDPIIGKQGSVDLENCTLENWSAEDASIIVCTKLSLSNCIIRKCSTKRSSGNRLIDATSVEIKNCKFTDNKLVSSLLYHTSGSITNSVFSGNSSIGSMIQAHGSNVKKEIVNNLFTNDTVTTPLIYNQNGDILLSQNTFTGNTLTGTTLITVENGKAEIHTNSLVKNTAKETLVNFTGGTPVMYNNTLSGNTVLNAVRMATGNARLINNTIYNSGKVEVTHSSARVINNIVAGGSIIAGSQANTTSQRNISGANYYPSGITIGGTDISAGFKAQFDTTLTGTGNGRLVHDLIPSQIGVGDHVILRRGGISADLSEALDNASVLSPDQKGEKRPLELSIGSVDLFNYTVADPGIVISFDSRYASSKTPKPLTITLFDYILFYPPGIDSTKTTITVSNVTSPNGTLSSLSNGKNVTFSPRIDEGGEYTGGTSPATFDFTVTATEGNYSRTGSATIIVSDLGSPPGLIKPSDFPTTCYDYMGTVAFTSSYRFITSYTGNKDPVTGQSKDVSPPLNSSDQRMYGFSIPLVGDLDGDGYPEIIGTGKRDKDNDLEPHYNVLYIYNGQTGKLISRLPFDLAEGKNEANNNGNHSSPSIVALVDADRDGKIEVIAAFPGSSSSGTFPYTNKLTSYVLTPVKNGANTTYTMTLNPRWPSTPPTYNAGAGSYKRAIPQIVDINGDGEAEVVVYNKIYSAKTGRLKVTLEALGSTAYVGSAIANSFSQDGYINFSYIYDLDLDGNYDVVAGGKVYYNIDVKKGTYAVRDFSGKVKDGRTGVADIDGDGIPDVVVVNRITSDNDLEIYVWDPGFLEIDGSRNVVKKTQLSQLADTNLKAHCSLPLKHPGYGINSYVYIGDIDGREQLYNGEMRRLPEIAVLAGDLTYNSALIHPNVAGLGIPVSGKSSPHTGKEGVLAAVTWDYTATTPQTRLKLSFVLGHNDSSGNTGFTMFDFDNDGLMEICYRDEATLRIIKASTPYVTDKSADPNVVLFNRPAVSYTGFEYPVIADIDNDASAEIIVMGHNENRTDAYGFIYALGNGTGDKFAPALPVWNQFMYDPFKINPDLTTPIGPARNRLEYKYNKRITKGNKDTTVYNYQPYNNTLNQIFYYESTVENKENYMAPIIFLTQAYIAPETDPVKAKRPKIVIENGKYYVEITIGNKATAKTDISVQTPIAIYETNVSTTSYIKTVRPETVLDTSNKTFNKVVKAGEEARIRIPVDSPYKAYYIRLGDDSGYAGPKDTNWVWRFGDNNSSSRAYRDCDWRDQTVKVSLLSANSDAVAIQPYGTVSIDIFGNDEFPDDLPADQKLVQHVVKTKPIAGSVLFANNKVIYTHDDRAPLPDNVDSFRYEISYRPNGGAPVTFTAFVYIYVVEAGGGGFVACYGNKLTTKLKENPAGIRFLWNTNPGGSDLYPDNYTGGTDSLTISFGAIATPETYKVKPLLSFYNNERIDFTPAHLTIGVLGGSAGDKAVFRWTGETDTNWDNPRNWVEVKRGVEIPVLFVPTGCVDVVIPSELQNYPALTAPATCANISMKDRAMIAGINWLTYDSARVELKLNTTEKNRFIMWSAPLKSMYSGDYHFKDATNKPQWGDVYMNLFQHANPDGTFTATFGSLGESLSSGKAFNLKVTGTTANKDKLFVFPQTAISYMDAKGKSYAGLSRTNGSKFIIDKDSAATFSLKVENEVAESPLVLIVNPYMAYLEIDSFLTANSGKLSATYAIWDGQITNSFQQIGTIGNPGNRFIISTIPPHSVPPGFIPPLQSFFVQKAGKSAVEKVSMSADWTTTVSGNPYKLRSDMEETNILRIKAVQGNRTSYAVLHYNESTSPAYNSKEDMHRLFYQLEDNVIPLEVYSFAPANEALAINASSDFSQNTPLGLRTDKAGSITLEFSGMATFGHNVYLIDHALNNKETDLQENPAYTFTVTKKSASDKMIELNDRFSLRTTYIGLGNEDVGTTDNVSVSSQDGYIYVQTPSPVSSLQVYSLTGALVYSSADPLDYFRIQTDGQQAYIVKIKINDQYIMRKTFVK
jgi:hypothetical protein